jgi:hypothetical protein
MVFILVPHVIGWFGTTAAGQSRASAFTTLEMGLTLSLLPLLLSYGVAERALRLFWRHALIVQAETSGDRPARFGELLIRFVAHHRKNYILVLSTFTILGYLGFDLLIYSPVAAPWLRLVNVDHFVFIYHAGLLVYALLGVGLFNSMFAVTLGQPQTAFLSLFAAIVVMVVVGIPLSRINYSYSAVGFVAAAMTFVGLSTWLTSRVLRTADFCFASVL